MSNIKFGTFEQRIRYAVSETGMDFSDILILFRNVAKSCPGVIADRSDLEWPEMDLSAKMSELAKTYNKTASQTERMVIKDPYLLLGEFDRKIEAKIENDEDEENETDNQISSIKPATSTRLSHSAVLSHPAIRHG